MNDTPTPTNDEWIVTDNENYIEIASTKTLDSIASVHGGKTVGEQYDLAGRIAKVPQLERELTAVTEQRDAANAEFYRYYGLWDRATKQLETVTEQRDRLAEALEHTMKHMRHSLNCPPRLTEGLHACNCQMEWSYDNATEALQSLNQPKQ
jgi:hypothetical protein